MLCGILVCLFALAQAVPEDDPVVRQIQRIEGLASAEPPILSLDTRLRAAELLEGTRRAEARAVLDRAIATLSAIRDPASYAEFLLRAVERMAVLDPAEAEILIQRMPRLADARRDYVAEAYDRIVRQQPDEAEAVIGRALGSGGFALGTASERLGRFCKTNPIAASALYGSILAAFPAAPSERQIQYLVDVSRPLLSVNRTLALEGLARAADAGWTPDAAIAVELGRPAPKAKPRAAKQKPKSDEPEEEQTILLMQSSEEITKGPFSVAIGAARKITDPVRRTVALMDIAGREDLSGSEPSIAAVEALQSAEAMKPGQNRLVAIALLGVFFAKAGDLRHAERAVYSLKAGFADFCRCEDSGCDSLEGRDECISSVASFVDFLEGEQLTPAMLNLRHTSVDARVALNELARLLKPARNPE